MSDDSEPLWEGVAQRECGEHRTVGSHRAWCFDCSEWCYSRTPEMYCRGCELPGLRAKLARVDELCRGVDFVHVALLRRALDGR